MIFLIIGAGPGGYRVAEYAAKQGLQVVIAEQQEVGGTCLNRGCIPTKTYVHSTTFAEAVERQQQVVQQLRSGVEGILSHPNITLLRGHASFVDAHTVFVVLATVLSPQKHHHCHGQQRQDASTARHGRPAAGDQYRTAAALFAAEEALHYWCRGHRHGVCQRLPTLRFEVTVIEYLKECLPMLDSDIAKRLRKLLEKRGITFRMKTALQSLADIDADVILMATGRQANTDGLNLEATGITPRCCGFIPVDDNFRVLHSSSPHPHSHLRHRRRQWPADAGSCRRDAGRACRQPHPRPCRRHPLRRDACRHLYRPRGRLCGTRRRTAEGARHGLPGGQGLLPCQRQGAGHGTDGGACSSSSADADGPHPGLSCLWCSCCRHRAGGQCA